VRRRKAKGALSALADHFGTLPPLAGVALAVASYYSIHWLTTLPTTALPPGAGAPRMVAATLLGLARSGQYVLPAIFMLAALVSIMHRLAYRTPPRLAVAEEPLAPREEAPQPRNEHDIYRIWAGDWDDAPEAAPVGVETSAWTLALLRALEWKRFEELCAAYFQQLGFRTRMTPAGPDGGVDIHLLAQGSERSAVLVQCKAWSTYDVGVKAVRELLGVMTAEGVAEGVFVTTGRYTQAARDFAAGKEIVLIDGPDLLAKIQAMREQRQRLLLAIATAGDFTRPTCPSCGVKMARRIARASGDAFWGCPNFPGCRTTLRISVEAAA